MLTHTLTPLPCCNPGAWLFTMPSFLGTTLLETHAQTYKHTATQTSLHLLYFWSFWLLFFKRRCHFTLLLLACRDYSLCISVCVVCISGRVRHLALTFTRQPGEESYGALRPVFTGPRKKHVHMTPNVSLVKSHNQHLLRERIRRRERQTEKITPVRKANIMF